MDIRTLIPKDKFDLRNISRIRKLDFLTLEPIIPELLEWIQDINWPVARYLPPRLECSKTWHEQLLKALPNIELTILIGQYAQAYHLKAAHDSLTKNVMNWREFWPQIIPLPHPSPRNIFWLRRNHWFEAEVIPVLQRRVKQVLHSDINDNL